uniref:Uncharacterized protein n=1 Tax=Anolis carolinensis TaxID=28377 RepID=A0A803T2C8_ANOCA
ARWKKINTLLEMAIATNTTTYSTEQSEHFKPCKDKDLAYCLNDGECFVIETLTGSHKHCRVIICEYKLNQVKSFLSKN